MGFKVDTSFLRFLTMGALGARRVSAELRKLGFAPIELERYGTSNKIWATKVKRLRLPDALCIRTGLRVEIRAKSDLKIRMSDALGNPERAWDAGMRDEDLVALVACKDNGNGPEPAEKAVYFKVGALRQAVGTSLLGPAKSASEGAERDRTWPATVPARPGEVVEVNTDKIVVMLSGDDQPNRKQTYTLKGKTPYVKIGDRFQGGSSILAGTPAEMADLTTYLSKVYDPLADVTAANAVDRFAAVKALRFRDDLHSTALSVLESRLDQEGEARVALEAAGSAAAIGSNKGREAIKRVLFEAERSDLSMEAILILSELRDDFARETLLQAVHSNSFEKDERRQAAIWGLGKAGLRSYRDLLPFIANSEENVAFHAIAAFGNDTPREVIRALIQQLLTGNLRGAPAASEALRVIGSALVVEELVAVAKDSNNPSWVIATLGRLDPVMVRRALQGDPLLEILEPMLLMAHGANWLVSEEAITDMAFLLKQTM
jgi:hypothetical protein